MYLPFALVCLTTVIWQGSWALLFNIKNQELARYLVKFGYSGIIFIPFCFYHFIINWTDLRKERIFVPVFYLVGLVFLILLWSGNYFIDGLYHYYWGYYPKAGLLHPAYLLFLTIATLRIFSILSRSLKSDSLTPIARNQVKYVLALIGIYAMASFDFLVNYGLEIYPFGFIFVCVSLYLTSHAIVRYRLLDINIVIRKSLGYSLVAGVLTSVFVVLVLAMTRYLSEVAGITSFSITVIAALTIAFLFNPLKSRIQSIIDRIFYKTTYDYYATIQKVSHDLATSIDTKIIYRFIVDAVFSALKLKNTFLLLLDGSQYYAIYSRSQLEKNSTVDGKQGLKIPEDCRLVGFLNQKKETIIREELSRAVDHQTADGIADLLSPFGGEGVVPILIDDKIALLLILGEKLSGDIFTDEDVTLLNTIANQASIAIKNASLYAEKIQSERLASIGMMAATLAHEIKNPLASIKIFTQLLPEKYYDREFRESFLHIVSNEIQRINGLVTELLDFSKPTLIDIQEVDASSLLDETIELVSKNFEHAGIQIMKTYHGQFFLAGDHERLKQALLNILLNSQQAMQGGGVLEVGSSIQDKHVSISIRDNGPGIPGNILKKIFDPFFTTKQRGAGLGLAISKKIIDDHGGMITVESGRGKGTIFYLLLPAYTKEGEHLEYRTLSSGKL